MVRHKEEQSTSITEVNDQKQKRKNMVLIFDSVDKRKVHLNKYLTILIHENVISKLSFQLNLVKPSYIKEIVVLYFKCFQDFQ